MSLKSNVVLKIIRYMYILGQGTNIVLKIIRYMYILGQGTNTCVSAKIIEEKEG
jgi:hypothetical protein